MKVALSASFWNETKVKELLHSCVRIYTTQVYQVRSLEEEFGYDKIKIIPDVRADLMNFIVEREREYDPDVEFVHYDELFQLHEHPRNIGTPVGSIQTWDAKEEI